MKKDAEKTLYISDLDGTLLDNSAAASDYTRNALNRMIAEGLHFTAATARTPVSAEKILTGLSLNAPAVLMNGALIYDMKRRDCIHMYNLKPAAAAGVVAALRDTDTDGMMYEFADGKLTAYYESKRYGPLRDFIADRTARYHDYFRRTDDFLRVISDSVMFFTILGDEQRMRAVYAALEACPDVNVTMYEDVYVNNLWYVELLDAEASKKSAVDYIRSACSYTRVVGFGDNYNDLPLFEACDITVAPENAIPEVKAAADYICGRSDSDGVVKWIEGREAGCFLLAVSYP